jgi:hypothetical protein
VSHLPERLCTLALTVLLAPAAAGAGIELQVLGRFETGIFDASAAEIPAYDAATHRLFVVNGAANTVDVLDLSDPAHPALLLAIDLSPYGAQGNSVAVRDGLVAVAVQAAAKTDPGAVVLFDTVGAFLAQATAGALPDMVAFTPDGRRVLVANEGEPSDDYTVDPEGSITVVTLPEDVTTLSAGDVATADFHRFDQLGVPAGVRIFGPGATVAQDLEPEYIAVSADSKRAWVTLQENNALALVDVEEARIIRLLPLGTKDHSRPGNELDPSNRDSGIEIASWPVEGMYLPDAILALPIGQGGGTVLVTANEGDTRDWDAFSEEARVKDLTLDPAAFPDPDLQLDENAGRLKVTSTAGDVDGDGDYDRLYSFGARSVSFWNPAGRLLWDGGADLEGLTAALLPDAFNSDNTENDGFDDRSDDKGPEPEGLAWGEIGGRRYLFVGLERIGGIVVYEILGPNRAEIVGYANSRDFAGDPQAGTAGDLGPEGLVFIPATDSPNGEPLLVVANEVSGSTTVFRVTQTP